MCSCSMQGGHTQLHVKFPMLSLCLQFSPVIFTHKNEHTPYFLNGLHHLFKNNLNLKIIHFPCLVHCNGCHYNNLYHCLYTICLSWPFTVSYHEAVHEPLFNYRDKTKGILPSFLRQSLIPDVMIDVCVKSMMVSALPIGMR